MSYAVDIAADMNAVDEDGHVLAFLDSARDPSLIVPGELVVAGTPTFASLCIVEEVEPRPERGGLVDLLVLPGPLGIYRSALQRATRGEPASV